MSNTISTNKASLFLDTCVNVLSVILHPILIPFYMLSFTLFMNDNIFVGYDATYKISVLRIAFLNLVFFPWLCIILLKQLKFIKSYSIVEKNDRIITLFALAIFYFWNFYVFKNFNFFPKLLIRLDLAYFIGISLAPIATYFRKISLYVLESFIILFATIFQYFNSDKHFFVYPILSYTILLCGLVSTLRMYKEKHTDREIVYSIYIAFITNLITNVILKFM